MRALRVVVVTIGMLAIAGAAVAQNRGSARLSGKVVDEAGQPLADVEIRGVMTGQTHLPPVTAKSNKKGEWSLSNLAAGEWNVDFAKAPLEARTIKLQVEEGARSQPIDVKLEKPKPKVDPNAEIQAEMQKAAALLQSTKFAEARAIYDAILAKYPTVHQLHSFIARTYAAENQFDKAIEHLKIAIEKDPANADNKTLLGDLLLEKGDKAEALKILESIDLTQVKDPFPFLNAAITMINGGRTADAIVLLDKVAAQFPTQAEVYYYRGRAHMSASKLPEAKTDLEKFVSMAAPTSPQLADAKKILEQLNKKQ